MSSEPQPKIPLRPLGNSGPLVSELGLGCNRIGEDLHSDCEWIRMLRRAADLGITLFDTAAQYAGGRSEELLGRAFGNRGDVHIATKVSPVNLEGRPRFPKEEVVAGAERSLRALRRDRLDVFQTHGSGSLEEQSDPEWAEAMECLRFQGKIRLRAAAVFDAEGGIRMMETGRVDALQITYNLLDTEHADPILPVAERLGVGLLARMPYQRGILTGKFSPEESRFGDHRARLQGNRLKSDVEAAERFRELGERRPEGMAGLAMRFVLRETRLSSTIPGARSIEQLEANVAAARAPALTEAEMRGITEIRDSIA